MQKSLLKKKYFVSFVILSIACLVIFASQHSALSQDNDIECFYYSDGRKIPLALSSDHIALRFKSGKRYHISDRFPSLVLRNQEKELPQNRLVLFNLQKNLTNADVRKLQYDLSRDPNIGLVTPVFKAPGASMIVTDEFIVQFAPDRSESDIIELDNIYGVEVVKKVTWAENTYILRVLNGDALEMANIFHELEEVNYAHPDFVRVMKLRPQSLYDRLYNSNEPVIIGPDNEFLPPDTLIKKNGNNQHRVIKPSSMTLPKSPAHSSMFAPQAPVSETTINTEGFEDTSTGGLPDGWQSSGTPTWGVVDYRAYSGTNSVYCVGSSVDPPGPYPKRCAAWMSFGPFSLLDAQDARVDLQAWIKTELNDDTLFIGASTDGTYFYGYSLSGDWAGESGGEGWMNISFDLKRVYSLGDLCEEEEVWIALVFRSDPSFENEGVYVDDIVIEMITGGYEDLTSDDHDHLQWSLNNNGQLWGIDGADIQAIDAWGISHGSDSITIAIIDEGVDLTHPDLAGKMVSGYDATGGGSNGGPSGDDAHGTNCAGIAAAVTDNYLGVAGIARLAGIMPIRIAYDSGGGWVTTDSWIADGINWAVTNGADVLSNSWGGGSPSTAITSAIDNAKNNGRGGKGAVLVFAAGNYNGPVIYPATLDQVLAAGALSPCDERKAPTSCDGEFWWGSNYGDELDISAPGVHMYSTDIQGEYGYDSGDYYYGFNGTSSSTPVVAGVAALILGYCPDLTASEVEDTLKSNADDLLTSGWDQYTGYGRVNAYEALSNLQCPGNYDELVADFGSDGMGADGVYLYDGTSWSKIAMSDSDSLIVWGSSLVADFGSDGIGADGIWSNDGTSWSKIANSDPDSSLVWGNSLVADFGSDGIGADGVYLYDSNSWSKIANSDPDSLLVWGSNLVADFGSGGIGADGVYLYDSNSWSKIAQSDPDSLIIWGSNLVADFGSDSIGADGIWSNDGTSWSKIANSDPDNLVIWGANLVADFGSDGIGADGIWSNDGTSWSKIAQSDPDSLIVWGNNLVADFGSDSIGADGIWAYDGSWSKIAQSDPDSLLAWGNNLVADFGSDGIGADGVYLYDGTSWSKIAQSDPENLVVW